MLSTQIQTYDVTDGFYAKAAWTPSHEGKSNAVIWLTRHEKNLCLVNTSSHEIEELHALRVVFKVVKQHRFIDWGDLGIKKCCSFSKDRYCVVDDWDPKRDEPLMLGLFLRFRIKSVGVRTVETNFYENGIVGLPVFDENFNLFNNARLLTEWLA